MTCANKCPLDLRRPRGRVGWDPPAQRSSLPALTARTSAATSARSTGPVGFFESRTACSVFATSTHAVCPLPPLRLLLRHLIIPCSPNSSQLLLSVPLIHRRSSSHDIQNHR